VEPTAGVEPVNVSPVADPVKGVCPTPKKGTAAAFNALR
jgi:hypothetical protein